MCGKTNFERQSDLEIILSNMFSESKAPSTNNEVEEIFYQHKFFQFLNTQQVNEQEQNIFCL